MTYQVLALKYRPQSFDEAIGQDAVVTTLKNAIAKKRLHHAYLFSGPRGIGKTSLARIFAKSLNCDKGPTDEPCQKCTPCVEITASRSMDVQEIDGASNTSVDDIRNLREHVKYMPSTGRYRIYIIDEVHMLSKSAFAALLKTLEEPPEHARFFFATTDPEKMPATILSRLLRFDLRRPSTELLVRHLERIAKTEKIDIDREGLLWIARSAEGSIRDSLSLLDRVVSFAGQKISTDQVLEALGITGRTAVFELLEKILAKESEGALHFIQSLYADGHDVEQFSHHLLEAIRDVLVFKLLGPEGFPDWTEAEKESVTALAEMVELVDLEYLFHVFHRSYQDIARSILPKTLLEVAVLRLCTRADRQSISELLSQLESRGNSTATPAAAPAKQSAPKKQATSQNQDQKDWHGFVALVGQRKPSLGPILAHARWGGEENGRIKIFYPDNSAHQALLEDNARQSLVSDLAMEYFGKALFFAKRAAATAENNEVTDADEPDSSIVEDAVSIFRPQQTNVVQPRRKQ